MSHFHRSALAVTAIGLLITLGACSAPASDSSASGASSIEAQVQQHRLKFTQCLRDAGFNVEDPKPDKGDELFDEGDPDAYNQAVKDCEKKLGPGPATGGADTTISPEFDKIALETARCLREKGHNVPDPKSGQGLVFDNIPVEAVSECMGEAEGK